MTDQMRWVMNNQVLANGNVSQEAYTTILLGQNFSHIVIPKSIGCWEIQSFSFWAATQSVDNKYGAILGGK